MPFRTEEEVRGPAPLPLALDPVRAGLRSGAYRGDGGVGAAGGVGARFAACLFPISDAATLATTSPTAAVMSSPYWLRVALGT